MRRLALALMLTLLSTAQAAGFEEAPMKPHRLSVPSKEGALEATLWLADGFAINVFAALPGTVRMMAESPTGELLVSEMWEGRVTKLIDRDRDGVADESVPLLSGLDIPHGLAFAGETLFVAETHRVVRLDPWWDAATAREIIRLPRGADIPGNPNHQTRTLAIGPDGKLYVSIGSYCDACVETDPMRAAVWRYNPDGSGGELFAGGLRNAVGLAWQPGSGRLWVTENGANDMGEELPPDELNVLEAGGDYGWPFCYGQQVAAPLGSPERCAATLPAVLELPAHIAPLGLAFYDRDQFPPEYRGDLFVAVHGSALRDEPVGYSLLRIPMGNGQPGAPTEFARGWLRGRWAWGRPVAPFVSRDGSLLLTDDRSGIIWRIRAVR